MGSLDLQMKLSGIKLNLFIHGNLLLEEERREVFLFPELLDLSQDLPLKLNGTNSNLLKLLFSLEERREVLRLASICQFLEQFQDLSQDLLVKLNGTSNIFNILLTSMEERREVFQFQVQLDLFQDLLLRLNGTSNNLHKLPSLPEEGEKSSSSRNYRTCPRLRC